MNMDSHTYHTLLREQLGSGKRVRLSLSGTSMLPTLHSDDFPTVAPLDGEPNVGDLLLFADGERLVLHRLVGKQGDQYTLQGDHNYGTETCHRSDLLGRVVAVEYADGHTDSPDTPRWQHTTKRALRRSSMRRKAIYYASKEGRRKVRPYYFILLAILMWAPLNGLAVAVPKYLLGLRPDHLVHASIFIFCAPMLAGSIRLKRPWPWLLACLLSIGVESVQLLLPWRGFDVNDIVANLIGVSLGWAVALAAKQAMKRRARRK